MKEKVAILVDGAFYLKRHRYWFRKKKSSKQVAKDLLTHCLQHLREEEKLYRIFFYHCPPLSIKTHHPLTRKLIDFSKTDLALFVKDLHLELARTRNFALRLGELNETVARWVLKNPEEQKKLLKGDILIENLKEEDFKYHALQKGVDMKIGLDIATLSYKKLVSKIILISGDSDFVSASKLARREGIEFILDAMHAHIKDSLAEHIDGLNTTLPPRQHHKQEDSNLDTL